jgi:hypothetical protein
MHVITSFVEFQGLQTCCHNAWRVPRHVAGIVTALLYCSYADRLPHVQHGDTVDREQLSGDGDGRAETISDHDYYILYTVVITL